MQRPFFCFRLKCKPSLEHHNRTKKRDACDCEKEYHCDVLFPSYSDWTPLQNPLLWLFQRDGIRGFCSRVLFKSLLLNVHFTHSWSATDQIYDSVQYLKFYTHRPLHQPSRNRRLLHRGCRDKNNWNHVKLSVFQCRMSVGGDRASALMCIA